MLRDDTGQSWLELRQALTSPGAAGSRPGQPPAVCWGEAWQPPAIVVHVLWQPEPRGAQWFLRTGCCNCTQSLPSLSHPQPEAPFQAPRHLRERAPPHNARS